MARSQFTKSEIDIILSDFEQLDFTDSNCFKTISKSYLSSDKTPLFNYVIVNNCREIMSIMDRMLPLDYHEEFRKDYGKYLLQVWGDQDRLKMTEGDQFGEDEVAQVLSDFDTLNFELEDTICTDPTDLVNFNNGWPADPFDKIANYYRWHQNIFLFNHVILTKSQEILSTVSGKLEGQEKKKENFELRFSRYLLRIVEGIGNGQAFVGLKAFFDGCYVACDRAERSVNHFDILNVNIKPGDNLETSRLFLDKNEMMEKNGGHVKEAKVFGDNRKLVTIKKVNQAQRNYCFEKEGQLEISWEALDKSGKIANCKLRVSVDPSGEIRMETGTVDGAEVGEAEILELALQNDAVLLGGRSLGALMGQSSEDEGGKVVTSERESGSGMGANEVLIFVN